eukprot:m.340323 g.340323  ORF g.340323 m.340323 type:complete len:559 (+) comp19238_c0_seq1:224-1900(+)
MIGGKQTSSTDTTKSKPKFRCENTPVKRNSKSQNAVKPSSPNRVALARQGKRVASVLAEIKSVFYDDVKQMVDRNGWLEFNLKDCSHKHSRFKVFCDFISLNVKTSNWDGSKLSLVGIGKLGKVKESRLMLVKTFKQNDLIKKLRIKSDDAGIGPGWFEIFREDLDGVVELCLKTEKVAKSIKPTPIGRLGVARQLRHKENVLSTFKAVYFGDVDILVDKQGWLELDLKDCGTAHPRYTTLCDFLALNMKTERWDGCKLSLSGLSQLGNKAGSIDRALASFKTNTFLRKLRFRNSIGLLWFDLFKNGESTITELYLQNEQVPMSLVEYLKDNETLEYIGASGNEYVKFDSETLLNLFLLLLSKPKQQLTRLKIQAENYNNQALSSTLGQLLRKNTMRELQINILGREWCSYDDIFTQFKRCDILETLTLNIECEKGQSISVDNAKTLAETLQTNQSIKHLSLNGQHIGYTDVSEAFADAVKVNNTLETFTMDGYLDPETPTFQNYTMRTEGVIIFTEGLKMNKSIKFFSCRLNFFLRDGREALNNVMKTNTTLEEITF